MSDNTTTEQLVSANEQSIKQEEQKPSTSKTHETQSETKTNQISQKIDSGERILQTTFKELTVLLTTLQTSHLQTINTPSLQEEQLKSISSEQLAQKLHDIEKQAQDVVSSYQNSLTFARNMNDTLGKISPQSEKNLQELNVTLEKITEALKIARQAKKDKLPLFQKQANTLHNQYLDKKLEEAGFTSERELDDQRDDLIMETGGLKDQIKRLKHKWIRTGKWLNRNQIQEKENLLIQKQSKLQSLSSLQSILKQPFSFASIEEMSDKTQAIGYDTVGKVAGQIQDWYGKLLEENKHETITLSENVLDSLNEDYFNVHVQGAIEQETADQTLIQQAKALFKESCAISMRYGTNDVEEIKTQDKIRYNIKQLPPNLQNILEYRAFNQSKYSINSQYTRMANFVQNTHYQKIICSYESAIKQLENLNQRFYHPPKLTNKLDDMKRYFTQPDVKTKLSEFNEFVQDFDVERWNSFRQNEHARQFFRETETHTIEETDHFIASLTAESLLKQNEHTDISVKLGHRLLAFTHQDIIPLVVMNAYRESGHSGEKPFLYITARSENTLLFKYINALSDQQVENLAKQNIPGLTDIIHLIKNNPQNFNAQFTEYPQPNPVYQQIQNHLLDMGLYYLKNKPDMQFYTIGLLAHIHNVDLKEGYQILSSLLEQSQDDKLKKAVLDFWHSKKSDFYTHLQDLTFDKSAFALFCLRETDPLLKNMPTDHKMVTAEMKTNFYDALQLLTQSSSHQDQIHQDVYLNDDVLYFLARQPERIYEITSLIVICPNLFKLISAEGPLYSNRYLIIKNIFANGDIVRKAKEIERTFSSKTPYWLKLFTFTDVRIGETLAAAESTYPIDSISNVPLSHLIARHQATKAKNPNIPTRLESIVKGNQIIIDALCQGTQNTIPFCALAGAYKRIVFRDYVRKTIETSQSEIAKQQAHQQNSSNAHPRLELFPEMLIHGSPVDCIDGVLLNGNLPKEALGEGSATDSYPFHIDFSRITSELTEKHQSTTDMLRDTISNQFGVSGKFGPDGQLFYLYRRDATCWETGKKYSAQGNENHGLILGGIPSTEISAIILKNTDTTLSLVQQVIVDHGFYIPCYNMEGKLLFTPQEYELLIQKAKPYPSIQAFLRDDRYLDHLDKPQASSLHKFHLKEHLLRTTEQARTLCKQSDLSDENIDLVLLAARLHDVGKGTENINTNQWFDNPTAALDYLKKIRSLDVKGQQEVLYLIQHDELIGDILQEKRPKEDFLRLFPSPRERKMLLALYQADVLAIDGTGELYKQWDVEKKLRQTKLLE